MPVSCMIFSLCVISTNAPLLPANGLAFPPQNSTARLEALTNVNAMTEPLRQLAPTMGAYVNEV